MEKRQLNNLYYIFTALIFGVLMMFPSFIPYSIYSAHAATSIKSFDKSDPLDDLMSVEGFDIAAYPAYTSDTPEMHIVNFVEYCYPYYANMNDNYGLYFYLYNPNRQYIVVNSIQNKVMIAVKYDSSPITSKSKPTDYEKFYLEFCSASQHPDYKNLFYKFKVVDHISADGKTIFERVNNQARRYDIGEIELLTKGDDTATAYAVTGLYAVQNPSREDIAYGTFTFSGYSKGYGENVNNDSTLDCKITFLESVSLDVKHSFYRTKTSSKGKGHQNQLDSVYFSVPKRFFDVYGRLQRIKAEWYEYKTKDIVVMTDNTAYATIKKYIGVPPPSTQEDAGKIGYGMGQFIESSDIYNPHKYLEEWSWNYLDSVLNQSLYYLFLTDNISVYDPYADISENGGVEGNVLYDYIKAYSKTFNNGKLPIKNGTISADLFADDIDKERKADTSFGKIQQGYSYYDFDADLDLQQWQSWSGTNPSFWQNVKYAGFWNALFGSISQEENVSISPIHMIEDSDMTGSDIEISEKLYIQSSDVSDLRAVYNEAITIDKNDINDEEKIVVLFHFATSDYFSHYIEVDSFYENGLGTYSVRPGSVGEAYRAQQSVFFDFDIIQLTFNKDGKYMVIPVVSSPIDIVNPITPPSYNPDDGMPWWLKLIIAIVLIILLVVLLWQTGLLPLVVKAVIWIVCAPFKAIAACVKGIKNAADSSKQNSATKNKSRSRNNGKKKKKGTS